MFFKSRLLAYTVHLGFSLGLYLAVVAIFFIDKGVDLWLLGVVLGAGNVVTAVMELPLGSLADWYGRLRMFRIGLGLAIIALAPLAFSNSLLILILSAVLNGIALFGITLTLGKNLYMRRYAEPENESSD